MIILSGEQKAAAAEVLLKNSWEFDVDRSDQRGDAYRGWWIHPELKPRRAGDAKKFYIGAETALLLYTDFTVHDLPQLNKITNEWIWPNV